MKFELMYDIVDKEKSKDYAKSFFFWKWWDQIYHQHEVIFIWRVKNTENWHKGSQEEKLECYTDNHKEYGIYIPKYVLDHIDRDVYWYNFKNENKDITDPCLNSI